MTEFKRVELTADDVISESAKSLMDFIVEARKTALKEEIRANTVIINKTFAKVNNIHFVVGRDVLHIPPMICGLEVQLTDELPDGYDFALVEAPETERERIVRHAKSEIVRQIFEEIESVLSYSVYPQIRTDGTIRTIKSKCLNIRDEDYNTIKKKYMEDE